MALCRSHSHNRFRQFMLDIMHAFLRSITVVVALFWLVFGAVAAVVAVALVAEGFEVVACADLSLPVLVKEEAAEGRVQAKWQDLRPESFFKEAQASAGG